MEVDAVEEEVKKNNKGKRGCQGRSSSCCVIWSSKDCMFYWSNIIIIYIMSINDYIHSKLQVGLVYWNPSRDLNMTNHWVTHPFLIASGWHHANIDIPLSCSTSKSKLIFSSESTFSPKGRQVGDEVWMYSHSSKPNVHSFPPSVSCFPLPKPDSLQFFVSMPSLTQVIHSIACRA